MTWWKNNNLRMIQNNLRESDANLNVDRLMDDLNRLSANVLMLNAGGIVAFYPTQLEYHYRAACQNKDLLREAIEKTHANGMKFIARFDFSKAHETIYEKQPDWFYRTRAGEAVNYHGIVHTCVNGCYQREYSLKILDEVLSNYEVDGIFFNMFGYQTWDYSGTQYGACYCDNCRSRFKDLYGLELSAPDDPGNLKYREFQEMTTKSMLDSIYDLVQSKNRDIAISTYHEHKVDIVRKESNTEIGRPYPLWPYSASENVKSLEDSWDDKLVSNCCINAVGLVHRFTGVSAHEVNIRLKESLASGSGLDFCIIGAFEDYPDRHNLNTVAEIFKYHRDNEQYYGRFLSVADVALIKPGKHSPENGNEYLGLFKMLKERHILFDVVHQHALAERGEELKRYKAVVIPGISEMSELEMQLLTNMHLQGVCLIATGGSFTEGDENRAFLRRIFGVIPESLQLIRKESAYLFTEDKQVFKRFTERDWIFLGEQFYRVELEPDVGRQLPYVDSSTFGPPERAFGHQITDQYYGAGLKKEELRKSAYIPWQPGQLYYNHGFADHKQIVLDILDHMTETPWELETNAPQNVEVFFNRLDAQTCILHVLNLSGFNGVTYFDPLPVSGMHVKLANMGPITETTNLADQSSVRFDNGGGGATVHLPTLTDFAAILIRTAAAEQ
ncbi:alpha-amylase family protein [Paenibacillus sepulcri]|uniref:Family 10 glycosylhydrolase n=1 Tax=Paenibacillus sepulcri TaxID=359917 RepID=A0ABS7BXI6_9BACL|nr:family 10 glycosylhydrolase [Paenibacillus sepulcri]